jgi:predicted  nucleic acid-binding Zn-ribbon protein
VLLTINKMPRRKKSTSTSTTAKAKTSTTTKAKADNPKQIAKERAEQLFEGLEVQLDAKTTKVVNDRLTQLEDKKANNWLEEEFDRVTSELEETKSALAQAKSDFNKLREEIKGGAPVNDQLSQNVQALYTEIKNNYLGINRERTRYTQMNMGKLLEKFNERFPFLR